MLTSKLLTSIESITLGSGQLFTTVQILLLFRCKQDPKICIVA